MIFVSIHSFIGIIYLFIYLWHRQVSLTPNHRCCRCLLPPESSGSWEVRGVEAQVGGGGAKALAREGTFERKAAAAAGFSHRSLTVRSVGVERQLKSWEVVWGAPSQSEHEASWVAPIHFWYDQIGVVIAGLGWGWGLEDSVVLQGGYCCRDCRGVEELEGPDPRTHS